MSTETAATTRERSFILPWGCKPWLAACGPEHPSFHHGYLYRREEGLWLLTTDSFIVCAIKVDGDAEDGFVHRGVIKALARVNGEAVQLDDGSWRVDLPDGHRVFELPLLAGERFPTKVMEDAGLWDPTARDYCAEVVALDPYLTVRLMKAMGLPRTGNGGVRLQLSGAEKAMRVTHLSYPDRLGLQMPMRLNG
jgi:hypothetical protein